MACPISKNVTFWRDCHETHFLLLLGTQGWCNVKNLIQLREWMVYCAWVFNITYHTPVESKILKKGPFGGGNFCFTPVLPLLILLWKVWHSSQAMELCHDTRGCHSKVRLCENLPHGPVTTNIGVFHKISKNTPYYFLCSSWGFDIKSFI